MEKVFLHIPAKGARQKLTTVSKVLGGEHVGKRPGWEETTEGREAFGVGRGATKARWKALAPKGRGVGSRGVVFDEEFGQLSK